jgi:L-alanine-DL-glutamate epimerase-like enolase superfamily enzyme
VTELRIAHESWPIRGTFRISRGAKTSAEVVVATLRDGAWEGRGECVPYARYGESIASVIAQIESLGDPVAGGMDRIALQDALPAGAARNALDCAFWELEAKRAGTTVAGLAGIDPPAETVTAVTLSVDAPAKMAAAARACGAVPLLKLKGTGEGDVERVAAVREAAPQALLIVDANEAWTPDMLTTHLAAMAELGVDLIEQPLPADADAALAGLDSPVPLCADESCHDRTGIEALAGRYSHINIKLDKTGGLTEALALADAAQGLGLKLMVGCMVGTSLAMAPATLLAGRAEFVDLDGPLLLAEDRPGGFRFETGRMILQGAQVWGG